MVSMNDTAVQLKEPMERPIDDLFKVHRLNPAGIAAAQELARDFTELVRKCEAVAGVATSRELSLVKTHLQEASYSAKRALAMNPAFQEPTE